jgi:hypothetical protein
MSLEPVDPQQPPEGWVGKRVAVYRSGQSGERETVGVLRAANDLGATVEVPLGTFNFYPWSAVSRILLRPESEETSEETRDPTRGTWRPGIYPLE